MKKLLALMALIFIGTVGWRVGESLSSDAVSMAVGLLLGVMAGIPTALLVLASDRRQRAYDDNYGDRQRQHKALPYAQQPPVIVVAPSQGQVTDGHAVQGYPQRRVEDRQFLNAGQTGGFIEDRSEFVDEW